MKISNKKDAENFLDKFSVELKREDFYELTPYSDGSLGFSAKKKFKRKSKNTTQLSVHVEKDSNKPRKPVWIWLTYGEEIENGVKIRSKYKLSDPIDIEVSDEYFYDLGNKKLYDKDDQEILVETILKRVYLGHVKPTRSFAGLWLRVKIVFWRIILRGTSDFFYKLSRIILKFVSGTPYFYSYLDDEIIEETRPPSSKIRDGEVESGTEGKKLNFFGYEASRRSIIIYSVFHIIVYFTLVSMNLKPYFIKTIFKINFLTVIYVILTLSFVDFSLPVLLMKLMKLFYRLSFAVKIKRIKI